MKLLGLKACVQNCMLLKTGIFSGHVKQKVNPNYQSYPFPFSFARSRERKGCFDQGVGVRGRYPLKPSIFMSLLETKRYPEHSAARSSRESHKCKYFRLK